MPADLLSGGALLALSFFGGLGKYGEHGVNLGNASTGAFSYRMGIEMARKSESAASPKTSGQLRSGGTEVAGRNYSVHYAR